MIDVYINKCKFSFFLNDRKNAICHMPLFLVACFQYLSEKKNV